MKKKAISYFTVRPHKKEQLDAKSLTVPNMVVPLKELLRRHLRGEQIYGTPVDWNSDFPEDEMPLEYKQNLDLTDVDTAKEVIENIKRKAEEAKQKEKVLKNVPLNKEEADKGEGTEEDISDIKTNKKSFE